METNLNLPVTFSGGTLITTSLIVAEKIKKKHSDVMDMIEKMIKADPPNFHFNKSIHSERKGNEIEIYIMDNKGFDDLYFNLMINSEDETEIDEISKGYKEIKMIFNKFYDCFKDPMEMNIRIYSLLHDIKKAILQIKIK